jgi:hypothetical protein
LRFHGQHASAFIIESILGWFELLYTVVSVEPTRLLIRADWTHASYVRMRKRQSAAFSDNYTLSMMEECWRSEGAAVLESSY